MSETGPIDSLIQHAKAADELVDYCRPVNECRVMFRDVAFECRKEARQKLGQQNEQLEAEDETHE